MLCWCEFNKHPRDYTWMPLRQNHVYVRSHDSIEHCDLNMSIFKSSVTIISRHKKFNSSSQKTSLLRIYLINLTKKNFFFFYYYRYILKLILLTKSAATTKATKLSPMQEILTRLAKWKVEQKSLVSHSNPFDRVRTTNGRSGNWVNVNS